MLRWRGLFLNLYGDGEVINYSITLIIYMTFEGK